MKKVLGFIKSFLIIVLGISFFTFAICMTVLLLNLNKYHVTQFGDTSVLIIKKDTSSDKYGKGDVVLVDARDINSIKVGDEVFAYKLDDSGVASIDFGIVGEIHTNDNAVSFENGSTYSMKFVIGEATTVYDGIGTYLAIVESTWGFLFIVLLPSFLIFIYEFYALVVEIKYGKEEKTE